MIFSTRLIAKVLLIAFLSGAAQSFAFAKNDNYTVLYSEDFGGNASGYPERLSDALLDVILPGRRSKAPDYVYSIGKPGETVDSPCGTCSGLSISAGNPITTHCTPTRPGYYYRLPVAPDANACNCCAMPNILKPEERTDCFESQPDYWTVQKGKSAAINLLSNHIGTSLTVVSISTPTSGAITYEDMPAIFFDEAGVAIYTFSATNDAPAIKHDNSFGIQPVKLGITAASERQITLPSRQMYINKANINNKVFVDKVLTK
ncbi:MAG: hypothetical protein LBH04_00460 [Tannerellaceae bacterium]|jgi:hypothetical protein|nr:hypothetical protein [Tannerellaceae bacterium]